jgi:hypothetical protein
VAFIVGLLPGETPPVTDAPPPARLEIPPGNTITSEIHQRDGYRMIIEEVSPVPLPPRPETPQQTADQVLASEARRLERSRSVPLSFAATVFDHAATRLCWQSADRTRSFEAWSNIDFGFLCAVTRFEHAGVRYLLTFGFGEEDTAKEAARALRMGRTYHPPAIPALPADPGAAPSFVVTAGQPTPEETAGLAALHDLFKAERHRLIASAANTRALNDRIAADRAANPPQKQDLVIKHWRASRHGEPATPPQDGNGGDR